VSITDRPMQANCLFLPPCPRCSDGMPGEGPHSAATAICDGHVHSARIASAECRLRQLPQQDIPAAEGGAVMGITGLDWCASGGPETSHSSIPLAALESSPGCEPTPLGEECPKPPVC
jgi:hypothetical protein